MESRFWYVQYLLSTVTNYIETPKFPQIIDAVRQSDGEMVALKVVSKTLHPFEEEISQMFSRDELISEARNHCIRIYEVLQVPDEADKIILVMPLMRAYDNPEFVTVGEAVDFFSQIFEVRPYALRCPHVCQ